MKILIVEDDPHNLDELEKEILSKFSAGEILIAKSRDSALLLLQSTCFDLVILDRNIPSYDEAMDADVAHGEVLYSYIMNNSLGTLVRFWTAYFVDEYISDKVKDFKQEDVWGSNEQIPTVGIIPKARFDQLYEFLLKVQAEKKALKQIEIRCPPNLTLTLTSPHKKILRVFARRQGGNAIEVANLTGGLSASSVVRASVYLGAKKIVSAAGKLSTMNQVKDEATRQRNINHLEPGAITVLLDQVRAGAGSHAGTFYKLADDYNRSLFDLLKADPELAAKTINELKAISKPWVDAGKEKKQLIQNLRREFVSDEILELVAVDIPKVFDFEKLEVDTLLAIQHCDLHGENVLLDNRNRAVLIDYGDVGLNHAAIDPITLELSAIFHPQGSSKHNGWPTLEQAKKWCDLPSYLVECPIKDYVTNCRTWAYEVAPGNRSFYAMAYVYLIRQFKYPDTDKDLAKILLSSLIDAYNSN